MRTGPSRIAAEHLLRHGRVLRNDWAYPVAGHDEPGGVGPYQSRIPHRREAVRNPVAQYRSLLRPKQRKGFALDTELALRLHTLLQVETWRYSMLQRDPSLPVLPHLSPL